MKFSEDMPDDVLRVEAIQPLVNYTRLMLGYMAETSARMPTHSWKEGLATIAIDFSTEPPELIAAFPDGRRYIHREAPAVEHPVIIEGFSAVMTALLADQGIRTARDTKSVDLKQNEVCIGFSSSLLAIYSYSITGRMSSTELDAAVKCMAQTPDEKLVMLASMAIEADIQDMNRFRKNPVARQEVRQKISILNRVHGEPDSGPAVH